MNRPLFGGAFQLDLPDNFLDVSQLRQVPDNQEVFVSKDSDESFVIELLETPDASLDSSIEYHWKDLCEANTASECKILKSENVSIVSLDIAHKEETLVGIQSVPKFGKAADIEQVTLYLYLLRIHNLNTDILISWNIPGSHPEESDKFMSILKSLHVLDLSIFNVQ